MFLSSGSHAPMGALSVALQSMIPCPIAFALRAANSDLALRPSCQIRKRRWWRQRMAGLKIIISKKTWPLGYSRTTDVSAGPRNAMQDSMRRQAGAVRFFSFLVNSVVDRSAVGRSTWCSAGCSPQLPRKLEKVRFAVLDCQASASMTRPGLPGGSRLVEPG